MLCHDQGDLRDGARVMVADYKRNAADFVLWKPSATNQVGWESPWGMGRPGWHIECSAMIRDRLGTTIDIHGGGGDLRFPHHDCEISQSECVNKAPLARTWVHNGMLMVDGKKMAKSDGNFITVRDLLHKGVSGDAIRLALLQTHYRSPLDWTASTIETAQRTLDRWFNLLLPHREALMRNGLRAFDCELAAPLFDDLNTPEFITSIHEELGRSTGGDGFDHAFNVACTLEAFGFFGWMFDTIEMSSIEQALFTQRGEARRDRDYDAADRLRHALFVSGISLKDTKDSTLWWRTANRSGGTK